MHSSYSAGPPPHGRLVARNAIMARFSYGAITSTGCNSHSPREGAIRDSALVSYFLFHFLPLNSAFVPSILRRFPSRGNFPFLSIDFYFFFPTKHRFPKVMYFHSLLKTDFQR
ncbi:hypothetical protein Goari_000455 [Gossypium aridum]|uniref:Uncharacterized protein n=1 Tax=Gossypium aridum TaxID=34290 RepID=A0A7J8YGR1_GOSAI|nr:hypothetical protein [Gossypium aridum]